MARTKTSKGKDIVEQVRSAARAGVESKEKDMQSGKTVYIPTGSTLLNLACSNRIAGAFDTGEIINVIGDKSAGKTFLFLTLLAAAAQKRRFRDHRLIYDDVEAANRFNVKGLFGKKLANRLESPFEDGDSKTIQDFDQRITELIADGTPFIYGLDSFDALTSDEEIEKANKKAKARARGKKTPGSYQLDTTKGLSAMFRRIKRGIEQTDSLLVIISQVRENITTIPFAPKYRRNGGRALGHYSEHEIWLGNVKKLKMHDRVVGHRCQARITKNKFTGKIRDVHFDIYPDYGIDDIGSCIDFLVDEDFWKKKGGKINAKSIGITETKTDLIQFIEETDGMEKQLRLRVQKVWDEVEEKIKAKLASRKRRFQ